MFKITDITRKILTIMIMIVTIALIAGMFIVEDKVAYIKGILLGTVFSVVKMILLERNINRSLDMDSVGAENYMKLNFTIRQFLTGAVLVIAALIPSINLWGAIIGVVALQVSAHLINMFAVKKEKLQN